MKRFLVSSLAACSIIGTVALGPAGVSAAVRHIPISHAPAPHLTTIEIGQGAPPATAACASCPQNNKTGCAGCPPQPQVVQINLVHVPL